MNNELNSQKKEENDTFDAEIRKSFDLKDNISEVSKVSQRIENLETYMTYLEKETKPSSKNTTRVFNYGNLLIYFL